MIAGVNAAKVNGNIYEWTNLETPLKNVIIEIESNSTRMQYKVLPEGLYSFDLLPGNYLIKAKYYNNNILEYTGEENIHITEMNETRNLDILVFPPIDQEFEYLGDINLTGEIETKEMDYANYIIIFSLIIILIIIFLAWKKKKLPSVPKTDEPVHSKPDNTVEIKENSKEELPDDLRELYEKILNKGGRTTQKDLRKEVVYGEAKVSLMVADLEEKGLIRKIKKGRSNIIIAQNRK